MKKKLSITICTVLSLLLAGCQSKQKDSNEDGIRYDGPPYIVNITDLTLEEDIITASALEEFYADDNYTYYYPSMKSEYIQCTLSDGSTCTFNEALEKGIGNLSDLDFYHIQFYMEDHDGNIVEGVVPEPDTHDSKDDGNRY